MWLDANVTWTIIKQIPRILTRYTRISKLDSQNTLFSNARRELCNQLNSRKPLLNLLQIMEIAHSNCFHSIACLVSLDILLAKCGWKSSNTDSFLLYDHFECVGTETQRTRKNPGFSSLIHELTLRDVSSVGLSSPICKMNMMPPPHKRIGKFNYILKFFASVKE